MMKIFIPFKLPLTNPQKSDPVPVLGIKVGMYLKNKTTEFIFFRTSTTLAVFHGLRVWEQSG